MSMARPYIGWSVWGCFALASMQRGVKTRFLNGASLLYLVYRNAESKLGCFSID